MAKKIMFQGTSSNVGKSILTTALCRILKQKGLRPTPFKAQNMALNSYVTKKGEEIGRAQVAQAEAAGLEPLVQMNPVLLKPTGNQSSQVVLMGKPVGVFSAQEYHTRYSLTALDKVQESLDYLDEHFDVIVIEGAGSPAEVNLKANDIVNMRIAKLTQAPVFLIADIDRGGAIASIVGTLALLEEDERDLVKGIIINKFRGDITLLQPALDFIENYTGKSVVGVIPSIENLDIDEEDSVALESKKSGGAKDITIAVIQTPKISNFTDFDALSHEDDVSLRYVKEVEELGNPDLIILPGSKNTVGDLQYLYDAGFVKAIKEKVGQGTPILGICGGYQMLGSHIFDPYHVEGTKDKIDGLALLPLDTTMNKEKSTYQVTFDVKDFSFLGDQFEGKGLRGYEIHMGDTIPIDKGAEDVVSPFLIKTRSEDAVSLKDGCVTSTGHIVGTYIHGILDNDEFRRFMLNALRKKKGLSPVGQSFSYFDHKDAAYNRLANIVEKHLDMKVIMDILETS